MYAYRKISGNQVVKARADEKDQGLSKLFYPLIPRMLIPVSQKKSQLPFHT